MEAQRYVWEGAMPLQIHLHESEVTTAPPHPPPALILAPRIGYLPLLVPLIKPHFSSTLPPVGSDSVWFDYKGLPLKWYIPIGVLFDLLCPEPKRPWNLTVHFRGYPSNLLTPCEGEDSVKWSFINSLKEADYIINGNCKSVMHMSQSDQLELWRSVLDANLDAYLRASSKLKLRAVDDQYVSLTSLSLLEPRKTATYSDMAGQVKMGRIPVRLYIYNIREDFEDLEDIQEPDSWDEVSYVNRTLEVHKEEGKCFTLHDALRTLIPEYFPSEPTNKNEEQSSKAEGEEDESGDQRADNEPHPGFPFGDTEIKLVRIQGIEPKLEIPFSWVFNNLKNPEHFLHICVYVRHANAA